MRKLELKSTISFEYCYNSKKRNIILQGGARAGKTYGILHYLIVKALEEPGIIIAISRKTRPALKFSAEKDFFDILKSLNIYNEQFHNKTDSVYRLGKSEIEFLSLDEPTRVRGRKRDYLFINEANEFNYEDFTQFSLRTTKKIIFDYNPHEQFSWIYNKILIRKDTDFFVLTYKDNPFLSREIVKEIEGYKGADENYWRIYGLGLRGFAQALIFTHWQYCDELPKEFDRTIVGLDFGYNNPSAVVRVIEKDKDFYLDEKLYQSHLTNNDLIEKMKELNITEEDEIYPDMSEPARLEELKRAGFNVLDSDKEVKAGIDFIKSRKIYVTKRSVNLIKELRSYSWKTKNERLLDEPVKENDHLIDATRYAIYSSSKSQGYGLEWL